MLTGQRHRKALLAKQHIYSIRKNFNPKVKAAVVKAAIALRDKISLDEIKKALKGGGSVQHKAQLVMEHLGHESFGKYLVMHGLHDHLFDAYRKGSVMGAAQLQTKTKIKKSLENFERVAKVESPLFNNVAFGSNDPNELMELNDNQYWVPWCIKPMPPEVKAIVKNKERFEGLVANSLIDWVNIKELLATQNGVYKAVIEKYLHEPVIDRGRFTQRGIDATYPIVIKYQGEYFIDDGHHRLCTAFLRGEQLAKVKLVDLSMLKITKEDFGASLNLTNQSTLDFLQQYLPDLITGLNDTQRQAVQMAIESGFTEGHPVDEIARMVRNVVGLTPDQAQYVINFRNQLVDGEINGMTAPWDRRLSAADQQAAYSEFYSDENNWTRIDDLVDAYQFSLLNNRAEGIATTEVHNASMAGQQDIWDQAQDQGLLDENNTTRHWLGTDDGREREEHIEVPIMNPDGVGLNEPFQTPVGEVMYPGQSGDPSFDIRCRCTVYLTFGDNTTSESDQENQDLQDEADNQDEEI